MPVGRHLVALAERLENTQRWPRRLLAFALGAISAAAVAPLFAWPVLLITLPVLALMLNPSDDQEPEVSRASVLRAAGTGCWFGFGYFLISLHWIIEPFLVEAETFAWLIPFAVTLLPGGLALFYGAATALAHLMWPGGWRCVFPLAATIGVMEWLRGTIFTGFPWNPLGDGLTGNAITLQWAGLFGIEGLNVVVVVVFALPVLLLIDRLRARISLRKAVSVATLLAAALICGGLYSANRVVGDVTDHADLRLRLVQPAIPQRDKWQPEKRQWVFDQLLDLSRRNTSGRLDDAAGISHIIWPEAALPFLPLRTPQALAEIAALLPDNTSLLTGALRLVTAADSTTGEREIYNSLLSFDSAATLRGFYDKQHLVPFGEYLPYQSVLEAMGLQQLTRQRGGFTAGSRSRQLAVPGLPAFTPLICYEVIFTNAIIQGDVRPAWLLVVTNDAWFGRWAGPRQHFHQARVRAVEQGLPLVRVSNNGISASIAPNGTVLAQLELNRRGSLDITLPKPWPPTVFATWGPWVFWMLVAACLILTFAMLQRRGGVNRSTQP